MNNNSQVIFKYLGTFIIATSFEIPFNSPTNGWLTHKSASTLNSPESFLTRFHWPTSIVIVLASLFRDKCFKFDAYFYLRFKKKTFPSLTQCEAVKTQRSSIMLPVHVQQPDLLQTLIIETQGWEPNFEIWPPMTWSHDWSLLSVLKSALKL